MAADGSFIIEAEMDDKKAQTELNRLNRKMQSLNDKIYAKKQMQMPLVEESKRLGAELDAAKAKLDSMKGGTEFNTTAAVKEQQQRVDALQKEWDDIEKKVDSYKKSIEEANISLDLAKQQVGEIQQKMAAIPPNGDKMAKAMENVEKSAKRFGMRLKEVIRSALLFTLITQGLAMVRKWMGRVIKANDEAAAAIAKLKGALLTLAQPLLSVIIPAFTAFVNVLTQIVSAAAQLLSMLFGKTIEQSKDAAEGLHEEAEALEGVGAAAKKASGSLAGFDEINTISTEKTGGGGAGAAEIAPAFDFGEADTGMLDKILNLVKLIGTALLYWKIPPQFRNGLKTILGLFMALDGSIGLAQKTFDAWVNGVTWDNLLGMLLKSLELATGLWLVFGTIGAAIGFIIAGITMLVTGIHDAYKNGWNLQNTLLTIAGILEAGVGIALFISSWVPLIIAAIASILLAITIAYGDGEALLDGLWTMLQGFKDFFVGVFTGDLEKAMDGISQIFKGLGTVVDTVIDAIRNMFLSFLDWLDKKTGGQFHDIIKGAKADLFAFFESVKKFFADTIAAAGQVLKGVITFLSGVFTKDWDKAWDGVKEIVKGAMNGAAALIEAFINAAIGGFNNLSRALKKFSAFKLPDWMGGYEFEGFGFPPIPNVHLPRLAAGAVIPPNREFMAILGDQRSGNNIEAPEALIRKIVREEAGGMNTELLQSILEAIRAGQVIKVNETVLGRTTAKAINKVTQSAGKSVLLY